LWLPAPTEVVALQLKLEISNQREITTADGRKQMVPYVGPVEFSSCLSKIVFKWKSYFLLRFKK